MCFGCLFVGWCFLGYGGFVCLGAFVLSVWFSFLFYRVSIFFVVGLRCSCFGLRFCSWGFLCVWVFFRWVFCCFVSGERF